MITINYEKCIGCLKCVEICPFTVLDVKDGKPVFNPEKYCLKCMHCAAVCPRNAVSFGDEDGILMKELPKLSKELSGQLEDYFMMRRSYRHFKPIPVPKDIILHALQVAAWAPSAKNQHPARWIVINNEDIIRKIMDDILAFVKETGISPEIAEEYEYGNNVVMGTARTLVLAYSKTNAVNPPVDSALALHTAELILQSQGIGTCWAGYLTRMCNRVPALLELFQLPAGCEFYGALMAGYPENETYLHIPQRFKKPDVRWL